ncbi:autotransporter domain-containing protein [Avibacterium paragallinarum]|uniref:autotransporter outer membrane beta-barrel domain-containing protein n=1 Tax=Avibacterium paragallinarum TaxID=728 RepID=UPI00397ABEDC
MKKLQRLPLAVLISIGLYGIPTESFAACTASGNTITIDTQPCEISATSPTPAINTSQTVTVTSSTDKSTQAQIRVNADLSGNGNALILDSPLGLRYTTQIGYSNAVNIQSDGTAILYNGSELRANSDGINIKNGSTVKGTNYSIQAPNLAKNNMKITVDNSTVEGNIAIKEFNNSGHQIEVKGESTLKGDISGITNINVMSGTLNVKSGQTGANYNKAYLQMKPNTGLNLILEDKNADTLLTTAKIIFNDNSTVKLTLGENVTADDIDGKQLTLLNITEQAQKIPTAEIHIFDKDGTDITDTLKSSRDLPKQDDEWVELVEQGGSIKNRTEGNNLVFEYKKSNEIKIKENSIQNFLDKTSEQSDFIGYILKNSIGVGNEERETFLKQFPKTTQIVSLSRQFLPDLSGADIQSAWVWSEQMRSHIEQRTLAYRHQLPSYEREEGWNLWASSSFAKGKNSTAYDYSLNRYGVHIGMDRQINDEALLGFSFGVNRSTLSDSNVNKNLTYITFMPYMEWKDDFYFAEANLIGGSYSVDSSRSIGNTTATGDYSGFQVGYQVTGGIDTEFRGVSLRPFMSLKQQWFSNSGWKETGSPFALESDTQTYNARHIGAGISLWKRFDLSIGKFVPSFDLQYYKQFGSSQLNGHYRLAGDTTTPQEGILTMNAVGGNQFTTKFNASLDITETLNVSSSLSYNKFGKYNEAAFGVSLSSTF